MVDYEGADRHDRQQERLSLLTSHIKDRIVVTSGRISPGSRRIASRIAMGRRNGPQLPPAEMAHIEKTIVAGTEGRSLIVSPMFIGQPIGRETLTPIIPVAVAPRVKTAVHTGATELVLRANSESLWRAT